MPILVPLGEPVGGVQTGGAGPIFSNVKNVGPHWEPMGPLGNPGGVPWAPPGEK